MVNESFFGKGRNDEGGNAGTRSKPVPSRWRYMIPLSAIFSISNDNGRIGPAGTVPNALNQLSYLLLPLQKSCVSGMFIICAKEFYKGDVG